MRKYRVTITMPDGSQGVHYGLYADGSLAVMAAMSAFPEAKKISAKRLA